MSARGALPCQMIKRMMEAGFILDAKEENVSPASLDLTVSNEIYRVEGIMLPSPQLEDRGYGIRGMLDRIGAERHNGCLAVGETYIVRLNEHFRLPDTVYGYANPKSSTGRNDVHVRILSDNVPRFDALTPAGIRAEVWAVIIPKSYPVKIYEGLALSQMRFFNSDTRFHETELEIEMGLQPLVYTPEGMPIGYRDLKVSDKDGSIILSLDLQSSPIGFRTYGMKKVMDLASLKGSVDPHHFFEPIVPREDGMLLLRKGEFYILSTLEYVCVPPHLSCEMVPMDERNGEFRSHYAGFIDPGWGCGHDGLLKGRPLTLELRPYDDLFVYNGHPIAKIRFERMVEIPETVYDQKGTSNYSGQDRAWLSKQFGPWR